MTYGLLDLPDVLCVWYWINLCFVCTYYICFQQENDKIHFYKCSYSYIVRDTWYIYIHKHICTRKSETQLINVNTVDTWNNHCAKAWYFFINTHIYSKPNTLKLLLFSSQIAPKIFNKLRVLCFYLTHDPALHMHKYAMAIKYLCSNPISLGWKKLVDTRLIWKRLKICLQVPD